MQFEPTPDQQAFIELAVASGRYRNAEDAVRDAMTRWEADERTRMELMAALEQAEADLEQGAYTEYGAESLPQLADELKQEARAGRRTNSRPKWRFV